MNAIIRPRATKRIAARIIGIYEKYHRPEYVGIDPLVTLLRFSRPEDLEVAGLVAAALSYGRVETIIRNINEIFTRMEFQPYGFLRTTSLSEKKRCLRTFRHRFNDGNDIALLLEAVKMIIDDSGSVEEFFSDNLRKLQTGIAGAISAFSAAVYALALNCGAPLSDSFKFLIPSPVRGGACKRMNMYLRWMVRHDDGIDRGVWKKVQPAQLVIPVDTHIAAIARKLGMTARTTADWRMAEEITGFLRRIDPFDPVRFDFSLCRSGMLDLRKDAA